jgi:hypothetical protein
VRTPSDFPRVRNRRRTRAIVAASVAAVAAAAVLVALVVNFASKQPDEANLGAATFRVANAERLAKRIVEQRTPFLFKDPLTAGPGREVYLIHESSDPAKGWAAVTAYAPGAPHELRCILQWDVKAQRFRDPCGTATFDAAGTGLGRYPATVEANGQIYVDLKSPLAAAPARRTSAAGPTS